ncbi:hypothetical protein AMJ74_05295 [candidate division WOR_3 bacterium SM1_77]|uniref:Uncharacterized protein n=1 Tax=candidate division WOR_3 bacterium SM1_77 TaxID=1703778 RepID=A0A0S8JUZ5_UNCW3|nr:MAG: hypothetical protein AMJ74_05295 [candidate division WOR_3 bacterium SM1_77]
MAFCDQSAARLRYRTLLNNRPRWVSNRNRGPLSKLDRKIKRRSHRKTSMRYVGNSRRRLSVDKCMI